MEKVQKQCMEVWQSANETIVENENTLELQAIGILIAIFILIGNVNFDEMSEITKHILLISFAFSIILSVITPIWFIRCRRKIQEKIRNIIHNHYKKNDGTMYNETDVDKIHRKYAGHILPFVRIHSLELLRSVFLVVCSSMCVISFI